MKTATLLAGSRYWRNVNIGIGWRDKWGRVNPQIIILIQEFQLAAMQHIPTAIIGLCTRRPVEPNSHAGYSRLVYWRNDVL